MIRKSKDTNKKQKGITLVALVVTVIILLILAGITITIALNQNGIIQKAMQARGEYSNKTIEEQERLNEIYSSIKIANNDEAQITINLKELKSIIDERVKEQMLKGINGINENSVLIISLNTNKNIGEYKINQFTHTFTEGEFEKYFEYSEETEQIICKQEGWYNIAMKQDLSTYVNSGYQIVVTNIFVNGVKMGGIQGCVGQGTAEDNDSNTVSIYLKQGDKINYEKEAKGNVTVNQRSNTEIRIIKI